jgi:hypothetical protein
MHSEPTRRVITVTDLYREAGDSKMHYNHWTIYTNLVHNLALFCEVYFMIIDLTFFNMLIWHRRLSQPYLHEVFQLKYTYVLLVIPMCARCVLDASVPRSVWQAFFTPTYWLATYFCTTVNTNCLGNHWLNLQPYAHKHNMICKTIRSHGTGQKCVHTTGVTLGVGNAFSIFFYLRIVFLKRGILN